MGLAVSDILRFLVANLLALALTVALHDSALAKRVALVIGNSAYEHTPELKNPKNDATDMAEELRKLGFQVVADFDLDKVRLERRLRDFAEALVGAEVGLFFYAGHGIQVNGQNYLIPTDAKLNTAAGLDFELVRLDLVQRQMEREAKTNIIFLDACRNNPLVRNLARAMGTRGGDVGRGLATMESGVGTLISFSTQPGNTALDGEGRNSPFTAALVKHVSTAGKDLNGILISVRNDVRLATDGRQIPWEHSALTGQFYFRESPAAPPVLNEVALAWSVTKDTTSPAILEIFIARVGEGIYVDMARARLGELRKTTPSSSPVAVAVAPPTGPPAGVVLPTWPMADELLVAGPLGDQVLGSPNAPVTVIEYSSMTCPHCADFHTKTYPALKARYIDTGKVRFIFREFPLDPLAAAASMLMRCAGKDKYFSLIDAWFTQQKDWVVQKPLQPMFAIAKQAGFTQQSFDECLANQQILERLEETRTRAAQKFNVNSTPTFFINGKMFRGALTPDELDKQVAPYLKG